MIGDTAPEYKLPIDDVVILDGEAILAATAHLPLTHLPADVEQHLADVEQRAADALGEMIGMPVHVGGPVEARPGLPLVDDGACTTACAGPCEPADGAHTAHAAGDVCRSEGHDLEVVDAVTLGDPAPRPVAIVCRRGCWWRGYRVVPVGEPDTGELLTAALLDLWADLGAAYDRSPAEPAESSIECTGLITRIVDITRSLGVMPAEVIPPALVASGVYVYVHRLAGHHAHVASCTMLSVLAALAERDAARGTVPAAPCEQWIYEQSHPAHDWTAPVDGPVRCPGWRSAE